MIHVDVETTGVQWYAHELFLVTFFDPSVDREPEVLRHPENRDAIQARLNVKDRWSAWNSKFDFHFLEAAGYTIPPSWMWDDGMVKAHIVDANRSVALKAVGEKMFGVQERDTEKEVKMWLNKEAARRRKVAKEGGEPYTEVNYRDVPDELMIPYAKQDVILDRNISASTDAVLQSTPELGHVYEEIERPFLATCYSIEREGIPVDRAAANKLELQLAADLDEIEERITELAGKRNFNPNSSEQITQALKRRGADLKYCTRLASGKISMDHESLTTVDDELAVRILEFRSDNKLLSTYVRPMLHESWDSGLRSTKAPFLRADTNRIHPNIRQVGAKTGRTSASDPNIQNWPRDDLRLRYLVHAEPGHSLVTVDLEAIEFVLFGIYAGGSVKDILLRGEDIHAHTANSVGLTDRRRSAGVESARQRGKTFNYAMIYGAGVRSIRKSFGVDTNEARAMIKRFHTAYPEIQVLQADVEWKLRKRGYVMDAFGRRMRLEPRMAYMAVNHMIQGTAAGILKIAANRLHKQGVPMVALVHDEIISHVPTPDAERVRSEIELALTDFPKLAKVIPIKADGQIVQRWSDAKQPGYVPSYDC